MFFWRRVAPQVPEEGLKPTATPGYTRNFRDLNRLVSQGKSFSGYERNPFFLNLKGHGFADIGGLVGIDYDDDARAVAVQDWDRDGDLDLWVTNRTAPQVRLLQNNQPATKASVAIRLIGNGKTTNRNAIGARLTLWPASDSQRKHQQIRTVHAGDGFLAQSSAWTHFGLGESAQTMEDLSLSLKVAWPGGDVTTYAGLKAGARYLIRQDAQRPEVSELATVRLPPKPVEEASEDSGRHGFWVANRVPFPKLAYTDLAGATRSTTDWLGQPVLINLWATWCAPCLEELRDFGEHADALRSLGATVLALNVDHLEVIGGAVSNANAEDVLTRIGYHLPLGVARQENLGKIQVLIEYLCSRRTPLSIPSSFLVDAEGNVASVYLESVSWHQLARDLSLLQAPAAAQLERLTPRPGKWFASPGQIDRSAYLGDYATLFGRSGFPQESQRLYQMIKPQGETRTAQQYYNQAKAAAQQGLTNRAMEYYRAAIKLDPEYGQALTGLGALLLKQERAGDAKVLFEKALQVDPNHATALINLAMIDQAQGDDKSALQRLQKVIARNPGYAEAHLNLGSLLASMKRHDAAIPHLVQAVNLSPKWAPAHLNLASAYLETKQWKKAEQHYRQAQSLKPKMAFAHYGLGLVQAAQQNHAGAVASYRKAIGLGSRTPKSYTQLGLSYLALGNREIAGQAFRAALKLEPNYAPAKKALREAGFPPSK